MRRLVVAALVNLCGWTRHFPARNCWPARFSLRLEDRWQTGYWAEET